MENNTIFLDTNIVADLIDASRPNHVQSLELLKYLVLNNYKICISEDMITTVYYVSKDKKHTLNFLEHVIFRDWTILIFGESVLKEAVQMSLDKNLDLEDALQCLCAKENGCEVLITNDKKFYDCGIEIMHCAEFLEDKK